MSNAIEFFSNAEKEVRSLDIPSKEAVQALARSAMRMVAVDLANKNPMGAVDTHDRTQAIEDYIKAKVRQEHADQVTQNIIAATRFRIRWEVGKYIAENKPPQGVNRSSDRSDRCDYAWMEDVFGNQSRSSAMKYHSWQQLFFAFPDRNRLDEYIQPWERPANGEVDELMWKHVWSVANPRQPKEPEQPLEVELSAQGERLYRAIKSLRGEAEKYFADVLEAPFELRELLFIHRQLKDLIGDLLGANAELSELTGKANE